MDYGIRKDANGNDVISWKGYDYSEKGKNFHQIGIYDSSEDQEPVFRLLVNERKAEIHEAVITDTLPEGMNYEGIVSATTDSGRTALSKGTDYTVSFSGRTLTIRLIGPYAVTSQDFVFQYKVKIPANSGAPLVNQSSISWKNAEGKSIYEKSDYTAQGSTYSASNGVKTADKTKIAADSEDQSVTYTFHFWNDQRFDVGSIRFTDDLDPFVDFAGCNGVKNEDGTYTDGYFTLTPKKAEDGHWTVVVVNSRAINASTSADVSFVTDFTRVPIGYMVVNTVNGSTVKTQKTGAAVLLARKTLKGGELEDEQFRFTARECDEKGNTSKALVPLEASNDRDGNVVFNGLTFEKAGTYYYLITEAGSEGESCYEYDTAKYIAKVVVGDTNYHDTGDHSLYTVTSYRKLSGDSSGTYSDRIPAFVNKVREKSETPAEPSTPATPNQPTEPAAPSEPEAPAIPSQPTTPVTPVQPADPTAPVTPAEPAAPSVPETPTPEKPSKPSVIHTDASDHHTDINTGKKASNSTIRQKESKDNGGQPQTGDESQLMLYFILCIGVASALALVRRSRR